MKINQAYEQILMGNYSTPTDEMATMCLDIITKLYPIYENNVNTVEDAFLVASALSYLNAYIKVDNANFLQTFKTFYKKHPEISNYLKDKAKEHEKEYTPYTECRDKKEAYKCFKKLVVPFMNILEEKFPDDANIKISPQLDGGSSLAMIEIYNVQFSFHRVSIYMDSNEKFYKMMNDKSTWLRWNHIRLQPIAVHVLKTACTLENLSEINQNIINSYKKQPVLEA